MPTESNADRLLADLDSADEHVRSNAAVALARLRHPHALDACVRTLDDAEEIAHADSTPSVYCLGEMGLPAIAALLDRLVVDAPMTRLHAQRAVEAASRRVFGFDGRRWPDGAYRDWAGWWSGIGYRYDATENERDAAVERLRAWIRRQEGSPAMH
ncbi:MAG: hypothetical protein AB7N65_16255 [Vicinamibacterales bacterium]